MLKKGSILLTAFDEYTIKEQIGQGGSGTVFLVTSSDDVPFALKTIDKNTAHRDKIKRFRNEINFCQKYNHPNIIRVLDYGAYKNGKIDCLFYVMPYYNSNLKKEIEKGIEPARVIDLYTQVLKGVEFAHEKGVWHRDIKPENILYDSNNALVVVADFGIAHFCEDDIITAIETRMEERLANYMYAAPEQRIKGKSVDGRADIFALGLILNEMFTKTIISGSKYKKIVDCYKEYGFLDRVVDEIISQDPLNRIYPVKNLFLEIYTLIKLESDKVELKKIVDKQINENTDEDTLFTPPQVVNIEYEENQLVLSLDKNTNSIWDSILASGHYSHSFVGRYEPHFFIPRSDMRNNCTTFFVNVPLKDKNNITAIVNNFKSWIPTATAIYIDKVKARRIEVFREESEKRQKEIQAKNDEMEIRDKLKLLI